MNIKGITVSGFGSFKRKQTFQFDPATVYIVKGRNGSGKSTFFCESLVFGLYNSAYKDMPIANIINDDSEKARITIQTSDGVIEKSRVGNTTELLLNGNPISQEKLQKVAVLERDLFLSSVVFGQGFGGFIYFKDAEKKKFITKISVSFIDEYVNKTGVLTKLVQDAQAQNEREFVRWRDVIEAIDLDELKKQSKEWESDREDKVHNAVKEEDKRKRLLDATKQACADADEAHRRAMKKWQAYEIKRTAFQKKINELLNEQIEIDQRVQKVLVRLKDLEKKANEIREHEGDCPWCMRSIKSGDKKQILGLLQERIDKLKGKEQEAQEQTDAIAKKQKKLRTTEGAEIEEALKQLDKKVKAQEEQHRACIADVENQRLKYDMAKQLRKQLESDENPFKSMLKQKEAKYNEAVKAIKALTEEVRVYMQEQQAIDAMKLWLTEFRNKLFGDVLAQLKPLSNKYLRFLSDGRFGLDIVTHVKSTKTNALDKFDVHILDLAHSKRTVDFERLSGGERKQVALAINFAWIVLLHNLLAHDWNLLVLDEIFDGLDTVIKDRVVKLLDEIRKQTSKSIVLITHDDFNARIPNFVMVHTEWDGDTSRLVVEK